MKCKILLPFFLLLATYAGAQMPLAYYDFELSSNRVSFNNAVQAEVNSGATAFAATNCNIAGVEGAGVFNTGPASGMSLSFYRGSASVMDPGTLASSYVQFKVNSSGFTGIGMSFQALANNPNSPYYGIAISTNAIAWTWIASVSTPGSNVLPWTNTWQTGTCSFPTSANNASNLYIRIYNYRTLNNGAGSHVRFDNLEITASATVAGVTKTMIDDRLIYTNNTSGGSAKINSNATVKRKNFVISGTGTAISIPYLNLSGQGTQGGNLTVSDNATVTISAAADAFYVDSARGSIPASSLDILSGGTVILNNALEIQGKLNIQNATLNLNGQKLVLGGTLTRSNALIQAANATMELNNQKASQEIAGSFFVGKKLGSLINSNPMGITVSAIANDTLKISGKIGFGNVNNSAFNTGDNVTLVSDATATAAVADITNNSVNNGNSIVGKVNVERYLSNGAKWRLLSVPTNGTQTFKQAWQESAAANGNPTPGYGILLGNNNASTYIANGFDLYAPGGPTVKVYNSTTGGWVGISNTNNVIKTAGAYMTYSRSSRSGVLGATTLRTKGELYTGAQPVITVPANKYAAIGNPYASEIDLTKLDKTGIQDVFYVWDSKLGGGYGLGAYQSLMKIGADYKIFPGGGSYGAQLSVVNTIESGQAFFVKADSTGGTIQFTENAKVGGSRLVFREVYEEKPMLRATLFTTVADSNIVLDGAMVNFDNEFSNAVNADDILKMTNGSENVSVKKSGVLLLADRRSETASIDTIQLNLTGLKAQQYNWLINSDHLELNGRTAFLTDAYTNTITPLNLSGSTSYAFSVVNVAGSYAANRFTIVFTQEVVLPVNITSISAQRNSSKPTQVTVSWKVENELNIDQYEVQHSVNAVEFAAFATQSAAGISATGYIAVQQDASAADNFYRIKATSIGGQVQYSAIVKVSAIMNTSKQSISVYPNPVADKNMHVQFTNKAAGRYDAILLNQAGVTVYQNSTMVGSNNQVKSMQLQKGTAAGNYQLVITAPGGEKTVSQVLVL